MEDKIMEVILSTEQEAAFIIKYGSLDYLQSNAEEMANNAIKEQANDARNAKIQLLLEQSDEELDAMVAPILAAKVQIEQEKILTP
jgi:hypothetical protein